MRTRPSWAGVIGVAVLVAASGGPRWTEAQTWSLVDVHKTEAGEIRELQLDSPEALAPEGARAIKLSLWEKDEERHFRITPVPVLDPALAQRYPSLRTWAGVAVDDPTLRVRVTDTSRGRFIRAYGGQGTYAIEPKAPGGTDRYLAAPEKALRFQAPRMVENRPRVSPPGLDFETAVGRDALEISGLATYRLAVATTASLARKARESGFPAAKSDLLELITVAVNEVNEIYSRDLGIRFELVEATDKLLFTDPVTEPFTAKSGNELLDQMKAVFDCHAEPGGYDLGHVFNGDGWSVAQAGAGLNGWKAGGTTGIFDGRRGRLDIAYFAHELGHQFGAKHTFSGFEGDCNEENFDPDSAVEPGSGSTLMGYADLCGADDLQPSSDLHFHALSIRQVYRHIHRDDVDLPSPATVSHEPPDITAGPEVGIPRSTSFWLIPEGEPDGEPVVYTWEQEDSTGRRTPRDQLCCAAIFPSRPPHPVSSSVTEDGYASCNRNCRLGMTLSARDVRGGGIRLEPRTITAHHEAGPFRILAPSQGASLTQEVSIRWDIAGTRNILGVEEVRLQLTCGDVHLLDRTTDNDGQETWSIPESTECESAQLEIGTPEPLFFDQVTELKIEPSTTGDDPP